jgi:O-antigen/teichoic acid export membrane protein
MADVFDAPPPAVAGASRVRLAFAFAASGRYVNLLINFAATVVLARLLTPAEVGLAMFGTTLVALPEGFYVFGFLHYLIQKRDLRRRDARAAFTVAILIALVLTGLTWGAASLAATF